jgi:NAD(P)H-dependent flavin oxidoreductase YrpB (nitropropane dioxygenase family)
MSKLVTRLTHDYGVEHPVALAGMAFVGTATDLAVAVCQAGGIGAIAVGPLPAEATPIGLPGLKGLQYSEAGAEELPGDLAPSVAYDLT